MENLNVLALEKKYSDMDIVAKPLKRLSTMFVVDHSSSMGGEKMKAVNDGIQLFIEEIKKDATANAMVDVGVVAMGGQHACVLRPIESIECWEGVTLEAEGVTPMEEALELANSEIEDRKRYYEDVVNVDYVLPWIIILTDGVPTDQEGHPLEKENDIQRLHDVARTSNCLVYTFFIGDKNSETGKWAKNILSKVATINPTNKQRMSYILEDEKESIRELFLFLSKSIQVASKTIKEGSNQLENTSQSFMSLF